ncbi:MAG: tail fiber domain-containing protein [Bryobacteraceae bacterium]
MSNYSKLAVGVGTAVLSLVPCLAQTSALEIDRVANWPAPLYWQHPAPSGQPDSSGRIAPGRETPQATETAQVGEAAVFVAITPCRLADTRAGSGFSGAFGPPTLAAAETRVYPVPSGPCSLPATAVAYSFNIAVVPAGTMMRWLTAWPDGDTMPTLATLNDKAGLVTSNAAIVAAGNAGAIDIYVRDATDVILDVNGYYALPGSLPFGGSAAAPALTFGDATTGLYSTGTGSVGISAEGTNVATVGSSGLSVPGSLDFGGVITWQTNPFIQAGFGYQSLAVGLGAAIGAGGSNTAVGYDALSSVAMGGANTAIGADALNANTGSWNTATGSMALAHNATGGSNTANGFDALLTNTGGGNDTAIGSLALAANSTGSDNTAVGFQALRENTVSQSTAIGSQALGSNTTGTGNTAVGFQALQINTVGSANTALGYQALQANVGTDSGLAGWYSTAVGARALQLATGSLNTAVGFAAGASLTGGVLNTFVGNTAGMNATTGGYNVFIANQGTAYPDTESNTIRIGDSNQSHTYISGIYGVTPSGAGEVVINSSGQLGSVTSSRRFKTDIADMGDTTETLMSLRPVQFRYIAHGPGAPLYYGLIAEEVAEIAPELVGRNANGEIQTVFYDKVNAMLLNQVQTQQRQIESQKAEIQAQKEQFTELIGHLESRLAELESRAK